MANIVNYDDGSHDLLDMWGIHTLIRDLSNDDYFAFWDQKPVKLPDGRTVTLIACGVVPD